MAVTHQFDPGALRALLRSPSGGLARDMLRRGKRVENGAKRRVGVDHGRLRSSITTRLVQRAALPAARVGSNVSYARHHHDGTGIYGPRGAPIRPKRGKVLVFQPKGSREVVFARSVRGSKPNPYLKDALPLARG